MTQRPLEAVAVVLTACVFIFSASPPIKSHFVNGVRAINATVPAGTLGLVEHRGTVHRINDLLDAGYRAASKDPFVQSFNQESHVAIEWAGLGDERQHRILELSEHTTRSIEINSQSLHPDQRRALEARATRAWAGLDHDDGE